MASVFSNANHVRLRNTKVNITTNVNTPTSPLLEVLYRRASTHAILNKGGRGEDAKCHPGTRKELIRLIERWMDDAESSRIFWMSAPAGGGKTAIMKTITERAATSDRGVHTVNFFFFRGDSTRNSAQPVVATLLYQLFQLYPSSVDVVAQFLSTRPRILDESLEEQVKLLTTLCPIIRQQSPTGVPVVLLVDGLDECDVDAHRSQADILRALEELVAEPDSPFRLLVASRRESHIQMSFNQLSSPVRSIFLDKAYSPEHDIRIFVQAEFDKIKASHPLKDSLPKGWPPPRDVTAIIEKSSGQFIYAATVMRYIAHPSTVPSLGLERVKGIVLLGNNSPFAHLDTIYAFILQRASDQVAMRDILSVALLTAPTSGISRSIDKGNQILYWYNSRYRNAIIESCISEMSAIIHSTKEGDILFYHASLADFLTDPARSGEYSVDLNAFKVRLLKETSRGFRRQNQDDRDRISSLQRIWFDDLPSPFPALIYIVMFNPLQSYFTFLFLFFLLASIVFVGPVVVFCLF